MSNSSITVFADPLGPKARARVLASTAVGAVVVAGILYVAYRRFADRGQLEADLWRPLLSWAAVKFFLVGLRNTLAVAAVAMVLASAAGFVLALGRLSQLRVLRLVASAWVEFFRGIPLVLLILFCFFGLPRYGIDLTRFWYLVMGLTLYNSAVIAEIIRAGILSLDRGQREAAMAVGLRHSQAMWIVILPQALRRMIPALVSQLVTLLKDTSLGVVISYEELLRRAQIVGQLQANPLQALLVAAALYIAVNFSLSMVARWLEGRQGRVKKAAPAGPITVSGVDDMTTPR